MTTILMERLLNNLKKCQYYRVKIKRREEIFEKVKVPEFVNEVTKSFCSKEHAEFYKKYIKGTPSSNACPYCKT